MNMKKSSVSNFSKAKSDPAICLFPGLFTSQLKGSHGKMTTLEYRVGQARCKELLRVTMRERLGAIDMRVLQGLTALACKPTHRARINPATTAERGLQVLDGLVPERTAADNEAIITAKFLPYELARVIGKDDSKKASMLYLKAWHGYVRQRFSGATLTRTEKKLVRRASLSSLAVLIWAKSWIRDNTKLDSTHVSQKRLQVGGNTRALT